MYDFKHAVELIQTKLGENSSLVQEELTAILTEANSVTSKLKEVNNESATRRLELKALKDEHAKELEAYSDYDSLKNELESTKKTLEESNSELKHVYDSKREKLKGLYGQFDFESDKLKPLSSRFKGLDSVDTLTYQDINQELEKFELLGASKIDSAPAIPNPTKQKPEENKNVSIFGGYSLDQK